MVPFGPGCFWFWLFEHFPPNVLWCEERLCSFIVTPFNAWTNLGYLGASAYVWYRLRKHGNRLFRFFSQALFWVGFTSFVYHASVNFLTQVFDFFGMYLFTFLLIMYNRDRVDKWPKGSAGIKLFWIWVVGFTALTTVSLKIHEHFPIQIYIFGQILYIMWSELKAPAPPKTPNRVYFWGTLVSMVVAVTFSILDVTRTMCDPTNHWFQGHGIWHLFGATALLFAFKHYLCIYGEPSDSQT
ncbi:MAG: ceramidase domain-containing protein [Bdellovibrionales bacterium]|nr:ceramidase domain-containing protein [Bdellovibrionales bacterium]